ncbi:hypothetical protein [Streptomyces sp. PTD9-10]|uniref:hypothetical protein n=1 Tax=Streptomyces sp. PTD9-10 TaxID=3120151 RepID=UPI00300A9068
MIRPNVASSSLKVRRTSTSGEPEAGGRCQGWGCCTAGGLGGASVARAGPAFAAVISAAIASTAAATPRAAGVPRLGRGRERGSAVGRP